MFFRGSLLRAGGRWQEACLLFRRLIGEYPNNYAAHRMMGRSLMILGEPGAAILHFEKSVHPDPLSPLNRVSDAMVGNCRLLEGKVAEAIDPLRRGLSATPNSERRSRGQQGLYLASAYALLGDVSSATIALKEATDSWPFATVMSLWPFYEPRGLASPAYAHLVSAAQNGLRAAGLREYVAETTDFGISPHQSFWPDAIGQTPLFCPGARRSGPRNWPRCSRNAARLLLMSLWPAGGNLCLARSACRARGMARSSHQRCRSGSSERSSN